MKLLGESVGRARATLLAQLARLVYCCIFKRQKWSKANWGAAAVPENVKGKKKMRWWGENMGGVVPISNRSDGTVAWLGGALVRAVATSPTHPQVCVEEKQVKTTRATNVKVSGAGLFLTGTNPEDSCCARGWRVGPSVFVFLSPPARATGKNKKKNLLFLFFTFGGFFSGGELLVVVDVRRVCFVLSPCHHHRTQSHWLSHSQSVFGCRSVR